MPVSAIMAEYSTTKEIEVDQMYDKARFRKEINSADRQLKSEIETRRAAYQMDRYVNINEVHTIVRESLNELYDKLGYQSKLSKENRDKTEKIMNKVNACVASVKSLGKLDKGMTLLYR